MRMLVVAPHPDDEVLGCGGLILRRLSEGADVGIVIVTSVDNSSDWAQEYKDARRREIDAVADVLEIPRDNTFGLNFPSAELEMVPRKRIIGALSSVIGDFKPTELVIPHRADAHTDHQVVSESSMAAAKWFRASSIQRVMAYETLSETGFGFPYGDAFSPTVYANISKWIDQKIRLCSIYETEMRQHPFPRNSSAVRALALLRGAESGFEFAEAFQMLRVYE